MENEISVNFGKYKGHSVERLALDLTYSKWLLNRPSFETEHPEIYKYLVDRLGFRELTPVHNQIQIKFLDNAYAMSVLTKSAPSLCGLADEQIKLREKLASEGRRFEKDDCFRVKFEERDWDVWSSFTMQTNWLTTKGYAYINPKDARSDGQVEESSGFLRLYGIELKPVIGDDFPAILRQLKKRSVYRPDYYPGFNFFKTAKILAFNDFDARSATLDQVSEIFRRSGILMCDLSDVSADNQE